MANQYERVFQSAYARDPNNYDRTPRWNRFYNAARRYAANINRSGLANTENPSTANVQISRRVYMGLSNG